MTITAILALEDGSVYQGQAFGAEVDACGEVVFNTSMVGYQEMLTDPSYAGQILLPTYPLIGNYGTNKQDIESRRIQVRGFIVREKCEQPSHYLDDKTIDEYLAESGIPGIHGIDTRAITRRLRSVGVMTGIITSSKTPEEALAELKQQPDYGSIDFVRQVSTERPYKWPENGGGYHVVALDCGLKYNILRLLCQQGCHVTIVPCTTATEDILNLEPDGILLSPGPGDPDLLDYLAATVKGLVGRKPMMGICLGILIIHKAFVG